MYEVRLLELVDGKWSVHDAVHVNDESEAIARVNHWMGDVTVVCGRSGTVHDWAGLVYEVSPYEETTERQEG